MDFLDSLDKQIFLILNGFHHPLADVVMWYISKTSTSVPLFLLLIWMTAKRYQKYAVILILAAILVVALADLASVHLFKNVFERLRPSHNEELNGLVHLVHNYRGGKFGFVSSHAANTFGIAIFFSLILNTKSISSFLIFWAILVSYSRIYLGVHYPGDILGGAILGSIIAFLIVKLFYRFFSQYFRQNG